ncbi:MAG TPA: HisA/HisF-related TIM barrel protein, partial [Actinomycetota bacterium]
MIVIPAIDIRGGRCVRLVEGDPARQTTYPGDPVATAIRYEGQGAHLLHVVDLDAALGSGSNTDMIGRISAQVSAQVQVGGGLRTAEAIRAAFRAGAGRIVIGSKATDTEFLSSILDEYGERVVAAVDVRGDRAMVQGWREVGPKID